MINNQRNSTHYQFPDFHKAVYLLCLNVRLKKLYSLTWFKIEISKQDVTTSKELPGAHLSLEDITTGKTVPVEEWISTDVPHMMKTLYANHVYRL